MLERQAKSNISTIRENRYLDLNPKNNDEKQLLAYQDMNEEDKEISKSPSTTNILNSLNSMNNVLSKVKNKIVDKEGDTSLAERKKNDFNSNISDDSKELKAKRETIENMALKKKENLKNDNDQEKMIEKEKVIEEEKINEKENKNIFNINPSFLVPGAFQQNLKKLKAIYCG